MAGPPQVGRSRAPDQVRVAHPVMPQAGSAPRAPAWQQGSLRRPAAASLGAGDPARNAGDSVNRARGKGWRGSRVTVVTSASALPGRPGLRSGVGGGEVGAGPALGAIGAGETAGVTATSSEGEGSFADVTCDSLCPVSSSSVFSLRSMASRRARVDRSAGASQPKARISSAMEASKSRIASSASTPTELSVPCPTTSREVLTARRD